MTRAEYEAKYGAAPAVATSTPIKMTRAEYEAKYRAATPAPVVPKYNPVDTLKGKTTFPANTETSSPLGNVVRTFGNIPSSAAALTRAAIAPVNPLDTESPLNIGANISKGLGAVGDIVKNRGIRGGLRDIAGGFAETATKAFKAPGEFIVGETLKAAQNPAQYANDAATAVGKLGIEQPLLVPSLVYGSGVRPLAPALDEATKLTTLGNNTAKLAQKLTQKSEKQIASSVLSNYKTGVKPLINVKTTPSLAAKYDEKVVNAVKAIKDNKAGLVFVDDTGAPITGQSPKTLQQFSDAVEQTKKTVFSQYDDLAKQAGGAGVKVDVSPIGRELDIVINNKALALTNPKAVKYAQELQERLSRTGALDATTAQDVIQNYNKSLEAFYRNPTYDNASQAAIDSLVANKMRESLDAGISGMTGTQYSALKAQYGALKAIEKDVIKASIRDARKNAKGLIDMTDIFSGGQVVSGIASLSPGLIASGITQKGIAAFYKYLNNPNRAINALFKDAEKFAVPVTPARAPMLQLPAPSAAQSYINNGLPIPVLSKGLGDYVGPKTAVESQSFQGKNLPNQSLLQTPAASVIPKTVSTNPMGTNVAQNTRLAIKDFPRDTTLVGADAVVQEAAIKKFVENKDALVSEYLNRNGNVINTDEARKLFNDVGYNGNNSAAVHEPASAIANAALEQLAKSTKPGGAFLLAGSSGAGKSSVTKGPMKAQIDGASIVLDGNLSSYDSAKRKLDMIESYGHKVSIPYIYREPVAAWKDGVVSRMLGGGADAGRVVPLKEFLKNLTGSLATIKRFISDGVPVFGYENLPGRALKDLRSADIKAINIPENIQQTLTSLTEDLLKAKEITVDQYNALMQGLPHRNPADLLKDSK